MPEPMTVREIVEAHLREIGADGLCARIDKCTCDGSGCSSDCLRPDCVPAYLHRYSDGSERMLPEKPEMDYEGRCVGCNHHLRNNDCGKMEIGNARLIYGIVHCPIGRPLLPKVEEVEK